MMNESPEYRKIYSFQTFLYCINQNYLLAHHKREKYVDKICIRKS